MYDAQVILGNLDDFMVNYRIPNIYIYIYRELIIHVTFQEPDMFGHCGFFNPQLPDVLVTEISQDGREKRWQVSSQ